MSARLAAKVRADVTSASTAGWCGRRYFTMKLKKALHGHTLMTCLHNLLDAANNNKSNSLKLSITSRYHFRVVATLPTNCREVQIEVGQKTERNE